MLTTLIVIAVLLILVVFGLLVRLQSLVAVQRGSDSKVGGLNRFNAGMFLTFLIVGLGAFFYFSFFHLDVALPKVASEHGKALDNMFWMNIAIVSIPFVVMNILLLGFAFKYQYKADRKATFYPDNHKLELAWTVIPAIVLTILIFKGYQNWDKITSREPVEVKEGAVAAAGEEVELEIVGQQFFWTCRYPGADKKLGSHDFRMIGGVNTFGLVFEDEAGLDDFTPRGGITVPKGRKVTFKIRAKDVIHSVFAPNFRVKMDAVPGMPTEFSFVPTKTTAEMQKELKNPDFKYEIACTEICGGGHFKMKYKITVLEPAEYDKWYAEQSKASVWTALLNDAYYQKELVDARHYTESEVAEIKSKVSARLSAIGVGEEEKEEAAAELEVPAADSAAVSSDSVNVAEPTDSLEEAPADTNGHE